MNLSVSKEPAKVDKPWNRDLFLRKSIRELSGTLQNPVELKEAPGFSNVVDLNPPAEAEAAQRCEHFRTES